jgi:tetratricopeptide (TPR) repeat protein
MLAVAVALAWVLLKSGLPLCADEPARTTLVPKPPWQRLLQGDEARTAAQQEKVLAQLQEAGKFAEALRLAEVLAKRRAEVQGADHWQAVNARWEVEAIHRVRRQGEAARKDLARSYKLQRQANTLVAKGQVKEVQLLAEQVLAIHRQVLGEDHPHTATSYNNASVNLMAQGRHAEAVERHRQALAIRRRTLGEDHPSTAQSYDQLANSLNEQGLFAEAVDGFAKALAIRRRVLGENAPSTATSYNNMASALTRQGRNVEAAEFYRKALAICLEVVGEDHPDTARSYYGVAITLNAQRRYAEAEEFYRKALAIYRKGLGENHRVTAQTYRHLGENLRAQGKYLEAGEFYRKALAIYRKVLGEDDPWTAASYNSVGLYLHDQGQYVEAAAFQRKALAIYRKVLGDDHPDTATSYSTVGINLQAQGQYTAAEEPYRKALMIRRKALGEDHPLTARSYFNLAANLDAQRRYAEAEAFHRKALAIRRKALGEDHPLTANCYGNLAVHFAAQGWHAEAEALDRKALAIYRKALGDDHPDTVRCYINLATHLGIQGQHAEAGELFRKGLAIRRQVLGEDHLLTAQSYGSLAVNQHAQGQYQEAEALWLVAAEHLAKIRFHLAAAGLERATITGEKSHLPALAAVLARNGKPQAAWQRFEESLARGTWDELSARLRRPQTEQARQAEFSTHLQRLDQLIEKTLPVKDPTPAQERQRKDLLTRRRQVQDECDAFTRHLEQTYGPAAGQVFDQMRIQAALPADTALVGWLDLAGQPKAVDPNSEHWAVLLRATGAPVWVRTRGSGAGGAWVEADNRLAADLWAALHKPGGVWQPLAQRLRQQRLEPLAKHLAARDGQPAVRHLIVLPARAMAGMPFEVVADGYTVSYALSGTLHAHLCAQPQLTTQGLLALADPVFDAPALAQKPLPLPPGGVLLTMVAPGANAAQAGLRPNDVLLRYHDSDLTGPADLKLRPESKDIDLHVAVTVWRECRTFQRQVRPGNLGVVLAAEPALKALTEQRRLDRQLALAARDGDEKWEPLPGTRVEVEALRRLFDSAAAPKLLVDSQASEQELHEMARSGELGQYRYLHLATHGVVDYHFPLRSAVLLARDTLPDAVAQLEKGLPVYDGRLTAEKVLQQWQLHSELVTLSACQTALGKYERGEGCVGFAQALLLAGSRAVVLSQWKVDDTATALLMERFYQNLLGKRAGLSGPLPKAQALAEAKAWLRGLSRAEALQRTAQLSRGVARGKGRPALPPLPAPTEAPDAPPYAHPYYWAAFVLIGDPR